MARLDLSGQRYGRLTVIKTAPRGTHRDRRWLCRCQCGKQVVVQGNNLRSGNSLSCGCLRTELQTTHGLWGHPEYQLWQDLLGRCYNPRATSFQRYGGRGITVCDRWRRSFPDFLRDMGPRPGPEYSIDRKDNDGPYSPENCRWATPGQQMRNTRRNRWLELNGCRLVVTDWARKLGMKRETLAARIRYGWPVERILTEPVNRKYDWRGRRAKTWKT